jgi:hypothetical protein
MNVGETNAYAREMPFHLAPASNPIGGVPGHAFVLGEVRVRVPGAGYVDVALANIVDRENGDYAAILTTAQVALRGTAYLEATVAGTVLWTSEEKIGGTIGVGEVGAHFPFHMTKLDGTPLTGDPSTVFATGDVKIRVPGPTGSVNATIANVVEIGYGDFALVLDAGQVAAKGKAYIYAKTTASQVWTSYITIETPSGVGTATITAVSPAPGVQPGATGGFSANTVIASKTPIVVSFNTSGTDLTFAAATINGALAYRTGGFVSGFTASYVEPFTGGLRLHIIPDGGWDAVDVVGSFDAIPVNGSAVSATFVWRLENTIAPAAEVAIGAADIEAEMLGRLVWQLRSE